MRKRKAIVVGVAGAVVTGLAGYVVARSLDGRSATEARLQAETAEFAEATGWSPKACRQIVDLGELHLAEVDQPEDLLRLLMSFQDFQGEDRRHVARYCVAFLVAPGLAEMEGERREVAQTAIKSILSEYAEDDKIVGVAYATAAGLGLREDAFVRSLANDTMLSPRVGDGVKRFVAQVMFPSPPAAPDNAGGPT